MTMLRHKIMDYFLLKLLILSILPCRVFGETAWGSDQARYDGYDLQKGPVFYEAYYPDDTRPKPTQAQQFQRNLRPETENWNSAKMMEKIYQTAGQSSMNNGNWRTDDFKSQDTLDRYYDQQKQLGRLNFEAAKNDERKGENLLFLKNRKFDDEYIKPILSAIESSAREILVKEFEKVSEMQEATGNSKIVGSQRPEALENRVSDGRQRPMANSNFPVRSDQPSPFDRTFGSGDWTNWRANDFFTDHNRLNEPNPQSPLPCKPRLVSRDNNYQPRASNYVMSATITPTREQSFSPGRGSSLQLPEPQRLTTNYWPARNSINQSPEDGKSDKNSPKSNELVPGVASIEISEIPRHKTRHHHGDKPRLNKHRRHAPGQ